MLKNVNIAILILVFPLFLFCKDQDYKYTKILAYQPSCDSAAIHTGLDLLIQNNFKTIKNKKIAIVYNDGSFDRNGSHILDIFTDRKDLQLVSIIQVVEKVYSSESSGMVIVADSINPLKNVTISPFQPTVFRKDLNGANLILIDLQNIGIRYENTLNVLISLMNLSAKTRIPLVLLDRPNPITASIAEGQLAADSNLVPAARIPWRYGLTFGELALLINEEFWIPGKKGARLYLIPMVNYDRSLWFDQTGLPWGIPLDEIYTIEMLLSYCTTCFFNYSNISNGLSSLFPYEVGGAPWISGPVIIDMLNRQELSGVEFSLATFVPGSKKNVLTSTQYIGQECTGIRINIMNRKIYRTSQTGSYLMGIIAQLYPRHFRWVNTSKIDQLFGDSIYRVMVDTGRNLKQLYPIWISDMTDFQKLRQKYRLYDNK